MAYIHKVIVNYRNQGSENALMLPALFTETGLIISHVRYLSQNYYKSESWRELYFH